tara:strand:- start:1759 stop:2172 length:414 start_codon:yes stop_codon:yes gene_type:complete
MEYDIITIGPGCTLRQPHDEDGYYCPICAEPLKQWAMYDNNSRPESSIICPGCTLQPDCDDMHFHDWIRSYADYIMAYRINWLDQKGWTADYLARLKRVLGIEESDLRENEGTLRSEWKRCWELMLERNRRNAIDRG